MLESVIVGVGTLVLIVGLYILARLYHKSQRESQEDLDVLFFGKSRYNYCQFGDIYQVVDQHRRNTVIETHDSKQSARTRAAKLNLASELGEEPDK